MNNHVIEFGIVYITQDAGQAVKVAGRCYKGPIRVGDTFALLYRYTPPKTLEDYGRSGEKIDIKAVSLKVESLWAYGRNFEEIHEGLTAEVELSGEGLEMLEPDMVLGVPTSDEG